MVAKKKTVKRLSVEHLVWDQGVAGSNPVFPIYGGVAQLARASGSYPGGRGFDPLRRYIYGFLGPLAQLVRALGS